MTDREYRTSGVKAVRKRRLPYRKGAWGPNFQDCRALWYWMLVSLDLVDENGGKLDTVRAIVAKARKEGRWMPASSGYVPQPADGVVYRGKPGTDIGKGPEQIAHIAIKTDRPGRAFSALSPKEGTHGHPLKLYPRVLEILGYVKLNTTKVEAPVGDVEDPVEG